MQTSFCSVEGIHKSTCADIFFGRYPQNFNNVGLKLLAKKFLNHLVHKNWQRNSLIVVNYKIFFFGTTAHSGPSAPHYWGFMTTLNYTHHTRPDSSRWVISLTHWPLPDNTQHSKKTDVHASGRVWIHNPSKWLQIHILDWPLGHDMFTAAN